jgi:hypothetical protein
MVVMVKKQSDRSFRGYSFWNDIGQCLSINNDQAQAVYCFQNTIVSVYPLITTRRILAADSVLDTCSPLTAVNEPQTSVGMQNEDSR